MIVDLLRAGVAAREFDIEDLATAGTALVGMISGVSQAPRNGVRAPGQDTPEQMARLALRMVGARELKAAQASSPARAKHN